MRAGVAQVVNGEPVNVEPVIAPNLTPAQVVSEQQEMLRNGFAPGMIGASAERAGSGSIVSSSTLLTTVSPVRPIRIASNVSRALATTAASASSIGSGTDLARASI